VSAPGHLAASWANNGAVLVAGVSPWARVPNARTIAGGELAADVAGSATVEVWRAAAGAFGAAVKIGTLALANSAHPGVAAFTDPALPAGCYVQLRLVGAPATVKALTATLPTAPA
jgi:hypothetical protein